MTQTIEFDPGKYLTPEQVLRLPVIAKERGFASPDAMLAHLLQMALTPKRKGVKTK